VRLARANEGRTQILTFANLNKENGRVLNLGERFSNAINNLSGDLRSIFGYVNNNNNEENTTLAGSLGGSPSELNERLNELSKENQELKA